MKVIIDLFKMIKVNEELDFDIFKFKTPSHVRERYVYVKNSKIRLRSGKFQQLTNVNPFDLSELLINNSYSKKDVLYIHQTSIIFSINKFKEEFSKDVKARYSKIVMDSETKKFTVQYENRQSNKVKGSFSLSFQFTMYEKQLFALHSVTTMSNVTYIKDVEVIYDYVISYIQAYNDMLENKTKIKLGK